MRIKKCSLLLILFTILNGCRGLGTNYSVSTPLSNVTQIPNVSLTENSTITPTLSPSDIQKELEAFLQTNGNCLFPCFWGIRPELTSYTQVESLFNSLGKQGFVSNQGVHTLVSTTLAFKGGGRVYFKTDIQNNVVQNIEVTLDGLWNREIRPQDWSAYHLSEILRKYGHPTSIELYLDLPNNLILYGIKLTYNDLDTIVLYTASKSQDKIPSSHVSICPNGEIESVKINLGKSPINPEPSGVPLSNATGLTIDDFYGLFAGDTTSCLDISLQAMGWQQ